MDFPEIEEADIIRAITETLKYKYPKIKVLNKDFNVAERPCFYIDTINTRHTKIARKLEETTLSLTLFYFAQSPNKDKNHLNDMKKSLRDFLRSKMETLSNDKKIILSFEPENVSQEINNTLGILSNDFYITFETSTPNEIIENHTSRFEEAKDNTNTEMMNNIDIKSKE